MSTGMVRAIFVTVALASLAYVFYTFATNYLEAEGSRLQRIWLAFKASKTIIWSQCLTVVSALTALFLQASETILNYPGVRDIMNQYMTPGNVLLTITVIGFITDQLRRWNSNKDS